MNRETLWQRASARWAEILAISPDLGPALVLQQELVRLLLEAAECLHEPLPPTLQPALLRDKWSRGLPALRNEQVVPPDCLKDVLPSFCAALADGGAGESALHIREALLSGVIDAGSLLTVSLSRNRKAIRTSALHMGFSPDLIWLIGELGSSPLAHHLQEQLIASGPFSTTGIRHEDWDRGYCAVCGSWPAFIETIGRAQTLRCSFCAFGWTLTSKRCVYCGNAGEDFVTAAPDSAATSGRVDLCGQCGNYTKIITVFSPTPFPLLAIEDLASVELDQGAIDREYRRPDLYDLDSIEPLKSNC